MEQVHHDRVVPSRIDHDLALERNRIHVNDIVAGHLGGCIVDDNAFENSFTAEDQIDDPRQIEHSRAGRVSGGDERTGGMGRIDDVHALAVFDFLARDADFLENFMGGGELVALFMR